MNRRWTIVLAVAALAGVTIFLFRDRLAALDQTDLIHLTYLFLLLALVGGSRIMFRGGVKPALRNAVIWIGLFLVTVLAVSYFAPGFQGR
jgi:hypothetical protein